MKGKAEMLYSTGAGDGVSRGALFSRGEHKAVVLPNSPAATAAAARKLLCTVEMVGLFLSPFSKIDAQQSW